MTPEEIARQWFDGFANRDVDKLRSLYHDDCFIEAHGGRAAGGDDLRYRFVQLFDAPSYGSIELLNVFEIGNVAILEFTYFEEKEDGERSCRINVCAVLEIRDQKIARERYYGVGGYPIDQEELTHVLLPVAEIYYGPEPWKTR